MHKQPAVQVNQRAPAIPETIDAAGRPTLLIRIGRRICVCMNREKIGSHLWTSIRPLQFFGIACWFDKSDSA